MSAKSEDNRIPITTMRLDAETLRLIRGLSDHWGCQNRTAVIRQAVRVAARAEGCLGLEKPGKKTSK
jgi:hypothetical protein